jgi:hypothetical protein
MLLLALLLFPLAEKAVHELSHLQEDHCNIKETHFCDVENTCTVCDYVFWASSTPPKHETGITVTVKDSSISIFTFESNKVQSLKYTFSLRGPPVC